MLEEMDVFYGAVRLPAAFVAAGRRRIDGNPPFPVAPGHHQIHRPEFPLHEDDVPRTRFPGTTTPITGLNPIPGGRPPPAAPGTTGTEDRREGKETSRCPTSPVLPASVLPSRHGKTAKPSASRSPRSDPVMMKFGPFNPRLFGCGPDSPRLLFGQKRRGGNLIIAAFKNHSSSPHRNPPITGQPLFHSYPSLDSPGNSGVRFDRLIKFLFNRPKRRKIGPFQGISSRSGRGYRAPHSLGKYP